MLPIAFFEYVPDTLSFVVIIYRGRGRDEKSDESKFFVFLRTYHDWEYGKYHHYTEIYNATTRGRHEK